MRGVPVHVHRVPDDHVGCILASAWKSAGLIVGLPNCEYRMFPTTWPGFLICLAEKKFGKKSAYYGYEPEQGAGYTDQVHKLTTLARQEK